ncbi:MAG: hypothetical protein ACE5IY_07805 [bacterium]
MTREKLNELKRRYNALLSKERKLAAYLENGDISPDERIEVEPEVSKIENALGGLLLEIENLGGTYTDRDVIRGFEFDE